jgi:DNA-binding response OmpR family regulator
MPRIWATCSSVWSAHSEQRSKVILAGVAGGRALLESPPDLVVSDLNMPFLDGFELLSLLQGDPGTSSIPVILLSGRSDGDTMAKAVELGAADFLTKPVTRDQLLESIEACLSRSRGRTTPPDYGSTPPV